MRSLSLTVQSLNFVKLVAAIFVGVIFLLQGCTSQVEIASPEIPVADIEPYPATVGVFYKEALATVATVGPPNPPLGQKISFVVGPASIRMFDIAFQSTFEKVFHLQSWPLPNDPTEGLDAIIRPSVVNFSLRGYSPEIYCRMEFLFDFYLPDGGPLDSWRLRSNFSSHLKPYHMSESAPYESVDKSLTEECVHLIMRDVIAQFIVKMADRPALKSWLKSIEDR